MCIRDRVKQRAKLKSSVSRLVCILFPELEKLVPTLHMASVYAMLSEFPGAKQVANAHLTRFTNLLSKVSKGRYGKETAIAFRNAAITSIGSNTVSYTHLDVYKRQLSICSFCSVTFPELSYSVVVFW